MFEDSVKKNQKFEEEERQRQKLYEQNRVNMRERMKKLKEFIKQKKNVLKTNEEFFEENKGYFAQYKVKNYTELEALINNYDKENPEELEKEEKEKYIKGLIKEHIGSNDFQIINEIKKFNNLIINSETSILYITKSDNFFNYLEKANKENEYNYTPDFKKYFNNKLKTYQIVTVNKEEICNSRKIKYNNELELIKSSNINGITYDNIPKKKICKIVDFIENGLSKSNIKNKKIKKIFQKLSEEDIKKKEKVEEIIKNINVKDKKDSIYGYFFCLKCNNIFKIEKIEEHIDHYTIKIDNYKDIDYDSEDLNYNAYLEKIYQKLKKEQKLLLKSRNKKLIIYYGKVMFSLYDIITNNFSIELLNSSIIAINYDYNNEKEFNTLNKFFLDYFLVYCQIISKLAYSKEKKIVELLAELEGENLEFENEAKKDKNENSENCKNDGLEKILSKNLDKNFKTIKVNFHELGNNDKKEYFLKFGLNLKLKHGKNESISMLYFKAKEQDIKPIDYENFIRKNLKK